MKILNCNDTICKTVTIPASKVPVPDIVATVTIPTGLIIHSTTLSHGVVVGNVWTIDLLPANQDATLDICFAINDCEVTPTGKSGTITVSTTLSETNTSNNTTPFTLDYIACGEFKDCSGISMTGAFILANGVVTVKGEFIGETAPTISTSSAGDYEMTVPAGTRVLSFTIYGNNTVLNGANEFVLRIDNTANEIQRSYTVSQYVANTGAAADKFSLGTNETETFPTVNVTQLIFPGMNGYGSTGFRLVLA
jgi:hypothetical protein